MPKVSMPKISLPKFKFPKLLNGGKGENGGKGGKGPFKWLFKKKVLISLGICAAVIVGGAYMMRGMKTESLYSVAAANLAEVRYYMLSADTANYGVQFYTGVREAEYSQDGKATESTPFAVLNVNGKDAAFRDIKTLTGNLLVGGTSIPFTLQKTNLKTPLNFAADIIESIPATITADTPIDISFNIQNVEKPRVTLANAMDKDAISWDRALRVAVDEVGSKIKGTQFETYVTIIDNVAKDSGAFWFVKFYKADGTTEYAVVAPDGSVIKK